MTAGTGHATPRSGAARRMAWAALGLAAALLLFPTLGAASTPGPPSAPAASPAPEAFPEASAAPGVPSTLVVLAYHPYPDEADPLGVPYLTQDGRSWDYFRAAYAHLDEDRDGFDFPSLVIDGTELVEGVPGGAYETTLAAYRQSFDAARARETPLVLEVESRLAPDGASAAATVRGRGAGLAGEPGLALHWAVVEDDVHYRPPPALSNGVFVHRFTVRAEAPWPPRAPSWKEDAFQQDIAVPIDPQWRLDRLSLAVWVQSHADVGSRFPFGAVLQAARHPLDGLGGNGTTVQAAKAVLLESFTASWCAACLFGDSALDTLARENGLASAEYREPSWRYLRSPAWDRLAWGALGGAAVAALALPPWPWLRRGGAPGAQP